MRIGLISREYPPQTGWGGIGSYVYFLARALAEAGHEVCIISRSERAEEYVHQDGPITVHRIRERKTKHRWADPLMRLLPWSDWQYSRRVFETVQALHAQVPFDVVEAPEYKAEAFHLVRSLLLPVVVKLHTPTYLLEALNRTPRTLRETVVKLMERAAARRAVRVTAPSRELASRVRQAWGLSRRVMRVVPNPIDLNAVPRQPFPAAGPPTILFVGRFERRKGVDVLLEAMALIRAQLPQARLVLVGGGSREQTEEDPFARWVGQEVLRGPLFGAVDLVPWQDRAGVVAQYARSWVVVVPSRYENYPTVCLEAMAAGRAVIGTQAGGIPEIVEPHVTGWLVPPQHPRILAAALLEALRDVPRLQRMGEMARTAVEARCDHRHVAARTLAVYAEAIAAWRAAAPAAAALADRPLRIAYVLTDRWIHVDEDTGAGVHIRMLWQAFQRAGHEVVPVVVPPPKPRAWVRRLPAGAADLWLKVVDVLRSWQEALRVLWRLLRAGPIDVIHERYALYGCAGWLASCVLRKPLIFNFEAPLLEETQQLQGAPLGRLRRAWAHWVLRRNVTRACAIQVCSRATADYLQRRWQVAPARIHLIPNGCDVARFAVPSAGASAPRVLFLGSLQPWHGCEGLLQAFAQVLREVPAAQLVLVGDGPTRPALMQQAQALGLNGHVEFAGQVPHAVVPQWLASAQVAVAPYPRLPVEFYFSPLKIFEYLAAGKAVVASRLGQIADVLRDGDSGLLVEPGDVAALSRAMVCLLTDAALRQRLEAGARRVARDYTWTAQAAKLLALYRDAASGRT